MRDFFVWCARQSASDIHIQGGNHLVVGHQGRLRQASRFVLAEIRRQLGHPLNAPKADPANRQIDLFNPR
ncbi:hypothetical protein [Pseudomonas savastanoi]|uniref:hypothetical protein n=1 Tax=Pseudomonas savastanoi TaxID=29438 RepID=UPI001EE46502|nr:hypothetical protein [Pseudomonas savastanoi]